MCKIKDRPTAISAISAIPDDLELELYELKKSVQKNIDKLEQYS